MATPDLLPAVETVGTFEKHTLPSGAVVYYRDGDHSYWRDAAIKQGKWAGSGRLTGVSTVVAPFDWRPDNLMRWAAHLNCHGVALMAAEGLSLDDGYEIRSALAWLQSAESITAALEDARLHYTQARDDAAGRGTNVHKHALHALATGAPVPRFADMTEEESGYGRGVMAFWHECEPVAVCAEQVVCDLSLNVAGRLDMICEIGAGRYAGARAVVDAKTSGYLPTKHHVQLAGYRGCAERSGLGETDAGLILQVGPDGSYELVETQATWEDFALALGVYRRAAAINRESNAARKAAA